MRCLLIVLVWSAAALACGPGRGAGRRRGPRKIMPLVYGQHVPNVPENHHTGSGKHVGKIQRKDEKFKELVPNYNADIIFKDQEGTGADRFMTQRCKEKLNTLSISVMNQWLGVKLRVTEGWDEENGHVPESLHYEGRAVDITTSDRDRSKYGMLARLAVEAGFDWVYYESRSYIHCSVKTESSSAGTGGGCFPAGSQVRTPEGLKNVEDLVAGDEVLTVDEAGKRSFSSVLAFLDRDINATREFLEIVADGGVSIAATPAHLIMVRLPGGKTTAKFAADIQPGDILLSENSDVRVLDVRLVLRTGVYAPLTSSGTLIVGDKGSKGALASCYAVIKSHALAHLAITPLRWYNSVFGSGKPAKGVNGYAQALYATSKYVLPSSYTYNNGI